MFVDYAGCDDIVVNPVGSWGGEVVQVRLSVLAVRLGRMEWKKKHKVRHTKKLDIVEPT